MRFKKLQHFVESLWGMEHFLESFRLLEILAQFLSEITLICPLCWVLHHTKLYLLNAQHCKLKFTVSQTCQLYPQIPTFSLQLGDQAYHAFKLMELLIVQQNQS